jgi:hypothetical protein
MTNTYTPQPGTIPAKVIQALSLLEPGTELTSTVLLEAIGQPPGYEGFSTAMILAVDHGLVHKRVEGRRALWSLPGGRAIVAEVLAPSEQAAQPAKPSKVRPAPEVVTLPAAPTCTISQTADPAPTSNFACALFSDGRLVIEQGPRTTVLSEDETRALVGYLERMAVAL